MKFELIWEDQFDKNDSLDLDQWEVICDGSGFGNNEAQYYTNKTKNIRIENKSLIIEAHKEVYEHRAYTSGKITTYGFNSFQYGKIVVRGKIPKGKGTWPAIWLLPDSIKGDIPWPECGEIDMMEHVGKAHERIHFSLHTGQYNHRNQNQYTYFNTFKGVTERFVDYGIIWTEDAIEFLMDDVVYARFEKGTDGRDESFEGWPFDQPFYLILNLAIGGYWGGEIDDSIFPVRMEIDSVKVYKIV